MLWSCAGAQAHTHTHTRRYTYPQVHIWHMHWALSAIVQQYLQPVSWYTATFLVAGYTLSLCVRWFSTVLRGTDAKVYLYPWERITWYKLELTCPQFLLGMHFVSDRVQDVSSRGVLLLQKDIQGPSEARGCWSEVVPGSTNWHRRQVQRPVREFGRHSPASGEAPESHCRQSERVSSVIWDENMRYCNTDVICYVV